jgi:type IV secretory pathway TraG/TraD family ATPase VirD4
VKTKNLGQKVSFERLSDSIKLFFQKLIWSLAFGSIFYTILFHIMVGIRYIFIPIYYIFYKIFYKIISVFSIKFISYRTIEIKLFYYEKMSFIMLNYVIICSIIFIISSALFFIFLTNLFNKRSKILNNGSHHRGLKVVTKDELEKDIKDEIESNETGLKYTEKDLRMGKENIRIPRALGASMWAFLGNAGTGKSQGISHMLLQIRDFEEKVMIVDPAGEYYKKFGRKDDVILSLYDVRSELYSFWNEGLHPLRIAKALIEDVGGNNEFWSKAGQALFAGLLELNDNEKGIYESLFLPYDELKDKLKEKKLAAGIVLGEAEQAGSVLSTAAVDLVWLNDMNFWPRKCGKTDPFSINKWVRGNDDKRWVFLTCSDKHWSTAKHLIRLWTDIAVLSAFERGESKENVPVWLVCDEISTIGKLPSMSLLEDRGRKYGMGLIAGFQTPSQLETIYGKALTKVINQGLQNQICFRASEQEMLEYMSQLCGEAEYIQTTSSNTFGVKNSESISNQIVRRRNVLPDEFKALKNMNAYLKVAGHNPTKIKINYLNLEEINVADASYMPGHDHWDGTLNGVKLIKDNPVFKEEKIAENIEIDGDSEMDSISEKVSDSEENNAFFDLSKISF